MGATPDPEALLAAVQAAEDAAMLTDVGDYGYGGEIVARYVVENWPEVVTAAILAYVNTMNEKWAAAHGVAPAKMVRP